MFSAKNKSQKARVLLQFQVSLINECTLHFSVECLCAGDTGKLPILLGMHFSTDKPYFNYMYILEVTKNEL